jgi:hypothetical protein
MWYAAYLTKRASLEESAIPPVVGSGIGGALSGLLYSSLQPMYPHEVGRRMLTGAGIGAGLGAASGLAAHSLVGTGLDSRQADILRSAIRGATPERRAMLRTLLEDHAQRATLPIQLGDAPLNMALTAYSGNWLGQRLQEALANKPGELKIEKLPEERLSSSRALALREPLMKELKKVGPSSYEAPPSPPYKRPYANLGIKGRDISVHPESDKVMTFKEVKGDRVHPYRVTEVTRPPWHSRMWKYLRPWHFGAGLAGLQGLGLFLSIRSKLESGRNVRTLLERAAKDPKHPLHDEAVRIYQKGAA